MDLRNAEVKERHCRRAALRAWLYLSAMGGLSASPPEKAALSQSRFQGDFPLFFLLFSAKPFSKCCVIASDLPHVTIYSILSKNVLVCYSPRGMGSETKKHTRCKECTSPPSLHGKVLGCDRVTGRPAQSTCYRSVSATTTPNLSSAPGCIIYNI